MADTKELRRLAQAATPGPWVAKNVSGAGLEIHMSHPLYPDKEWPAFGTDSAFCKKGLVSYETWTQFPHEVRDAQQSKNAEFIAAANPAVINELIDRLEAAERAVTEAYRRGYLTGQEEIEKERDDIAQQLVQSEISKREISEAHNAVTRRLSVLADENTALRAKIEQMGKQKNSVAGIFRDRDDMVNVVVRGFLLPTPYEAIKDVVGEMPIGRSVPLYTCPGTQSETVDE